MNQWLSIRVESERILVRAWEFLDILQWGNCSEALTKTIVGEKWKITMLTESRSWFPKINFVYAHGLCPVQRKNHRKNSWVVEKLKTVFEVLLRNKSLRRKTNWSVSVGILIRPAKFHSNKKNNIFMPILCIRVNTGSFAESRNSRVVSSVVEHSTAIQRVQSSTPGVP